MTRGGVPGGTLPAEGQGAGVGGLHCPEGSSSLDSTAGRGKFLELHGFLVQSDKVSLLNLSALWLWGQTAWGLCGHLG